MWFQRKPSMFNKAVIMDIGYIISSNISDFDCFIFHDVDMLSEDDRFMYSCKSDKAVHMGAYHSKNKYK